MSGGGGGGKSGKGKRENTLVAVVVVPGGGIKGPNNGAQVVPGGWLGEWHERWLRGPGCQPSLYHV